MLNEGVEVHNMMEGHFDFRQFQGRLDLRKAAIMGHSFGGATTIQALSQDHRFQFVTVWCSSFLSLLPLSSSS
jgi:dipeptidyl aminopeptidase/acylaminoacyl peptidase